MTQLEKDRLIEKFMGWELKWSNEEGKRGWFFYNEKLNKYLHKTTYAHSVMGYTTDWNRLMEALKKFDTLSDYYGTEIYCNFCDSIDYAVTLYNIDETVNALCEGIEWYNSTLN